MLNHRREPGARPLPEGSTSMSFTHTHHTGIGIRALHFFSFLAIGYHVGLHSRRLINPHYDDGLCRTVLECCRLQALICCHSRWPSSGLDILMVFTVLPTQHQFRVMMQREYVGPVSLTFDIRISAAQFNIANSSISQSQPIGLQDSVTRPSYHCMKSYHSVLRKFRVDVAPHGREKKWAMLRSGKIPNFLLVRGRMYTIECARNLGRESRKT